MEKLNYCSTEQNPYKHITTFLAPEGSFFYMDDFISEATYVSVWQDPTGRLHTIPMWGEEINEYDEMQEHIEECINDNRVLVKCMTCAFFYDYFKNKDPQTIKLKMDSIADEVVCGIIKTTPELKDYFMNYSIWGNLHALENDGTLPAGW